MADINSDAVKDSDKHAAKELLHPAGIERIRFRVPPGCHSDMSEWEMIKMYRSFLSNMKSFDNEKLRAARKANIRWFLAKAMFLSLTVAIVGGIVVISAFAGGFPASATIPIFNACLLIAIVFIGKILLSIFLSSDSHINAIDKCERWYAKVTISGLWLSNSEKRSNNFTELLMKMTCLVELQILLICASSAAEHFSWIDETRTASVTEKLQQSPCPFIATVLLMAMLIANEFNMRRIYKVNILGENMEHSKKDDENNGLLSMVFTHIGIVWERNSFVIGILLHCDIFCTVSTYLLCIWYSLGAITEDLVNIPELGFFKFFFMILLPSYLIYMSIRVATSILQTKWKKRREQADLEAKIELQITESCKYQKMFSTM